jgi:pimeloyl-ACP methyl ester carboxylesterase
MTMLDGVGHFPAREAPDAVAAILVRHFGAKRAARTHQEHR